MKIRTSFCARSASASKPPPLPLQARILGCASATATSPLGGGCDVISAIQYVKTNYEELGLDPTWLAVVGRSIAGHRALLAAATPLVVEGNHGPV